METAHVVQKSWKYHMQEIYFVWSFVSEIYMVKKREMKSLIIF